MDKDSDTDKWTDSESEMETPRNKKPSIKGTTPTPDHISEEGSNLSESDDNAAKDKSKLPQNQNVSKPASQTAANVKSDSESAWSDANSPRKSEPLKPQLQRIKSDSESAWSDNETPRFQEEAAKEQVKSDEESVWSEPEMPRPPAAGVTQQKKLERLKSESESAWSDDEPAETGKLTASQPAQPIKQETIKSESESQWSDEDSPRKTPPAFLEPTSSKPLEVMRQQSKGSVWSDDEDDGGIEALAAPKTADSKPPAAVTKPDIVKSDITRQQSVESAWSAEGDDNGDEHLQETEATRNPLSASYEVKTLGSTYEIKPEVKEEIVPQKSVHLQAPPTDNSATNQRPSSPAPPSDDESGWSETEETPPVNLVLSTKPTSDPEAKKQSQLSAVLGLDLSDDDSGGDKSDSELPLSTNRSALGVST